MSRVPVDLTGAWPVPSVNTEVQTRALGLDDKFSGFVKMKLIKVNFLSRIIKVMKTL